MVPAGKHVDSHAGGVEAAREGLRRAEVAYDELVAREKKARARYEAARARAKDSGSARLSNAVLAARQRADEASKLRIEANTALREARKLLREQQQLSRDAERKERARERAVAAFVKKWEREYDLDMKRRKKNIALRKDEIRRNCR